MPSPFDLFFLVVYERRFLSAKGHRRPRNSAGSSVAGVLHQRRKWDRLSHGHDPPGQVWPPAPPGRRPFARGRRAEYCCLTTGQGNERGGPIFRPMDTLSRSEARNRASIGNGAGPVPCPTGQRGVCLCQSVHERGGRICQKQMPFLPLMGLKYPPPLQSHKTQRPSGRSSRFCFRPLWHRPHPPGLESSLSSPRNRGIIMVGVVPMHLDKFKNPAYKKPLFTCQNDI